MKRPVDPEQLRWLEHQARSIGHIIGEVIAERGVKYGFALMLFSFEGPEFTWISNAERDGMIRTLEEFIAKLKSGEAGMTSEQKN